MGLRSSPFQRRGKHGNAGNTVTSTTEALASARARRSEDPAA
ncbi:hypothetical protein ACFV2S_27030 [Streptomyces sp. NPDC059695]